MLTDAEGTLVITAVPPTGKAPAGRFTGDAWVDTIADGVRPGSARLARVWFSPGARTAWHRHVLGQTLHVTEGQGIARARGGRAVLLRPGATVCSPPGVWHWHGALQGNALCHLALSDSDPDPDVPDVEWGVHVTHDEVSRAVASAR